MESLGITERDEALEEFNKGIELRNGRYAVNIPWKEQKSALPGNFELSIARCKGQLKRYNKDENITKQYDKVIKEQLRNGVVERDRRKEEFVEETHYLLHHPVIWESAEKSKIRILFNASSKNNKSSLLLNEYVNKGQTVALM